MHFAGAWINQDMMLWTGIGALILLLGFVVLKRLPRHS